MTRKEKSRHIRHYKSIIKQAEEVLPLLDNHTGICLLCNSIKTPNKGELQTIAAKMGEKFPVYGWINYYSLYGTDVRWKEEWKLQREDLLKMIISECRKNIKLLKK